MRLVSQDRCVDIPYERANVVCYNEHIRATVGDDEFRLAKYLTRERALKVMDMLINDSFWVKDVFVFPTDEEMEI